MGTCRGIELLGLVFLLGMASCGKKDGPTLTTLPVAKVRLATNLNTGHRASLAVTLSASQRATISTRMAASVKKMHVMEGQKVAAGAMLVTLSDEDLQSGMRAAQSAVETASTQLKRLENLSKSGIAAQAEIDMARLHLDQAKAGLAGVKANLEYTRLRAPFAGVVQNRRVNDGDFVGAGTPLVEIEGQGDLEFTGSVSEIEARNLNIGLELPFETATRKGKVRITALATGKDAVTHRSGLRAKVIQGMEGLRSGDFGRLLLPVSAGIRGDILVPKSALVLRGELSGVFLAMDGKAVLRWLSLGEEQSGMFTVRAGLRPEDKVIDRPLDLKDGQPIEVQP